LRRISPRRPGPSFRVGPAGVIVAHTRVTAIADAERHVVAPHALAAFGPCRRRRAHALAAHAVCGNLLIDSEPPNAGRPALRATGASPKRGPRGGPPFVGAARPREARVPCLARRPDWRGACLLPRCGRCRSLAGRGKPRRHSHLGVVGHPGPGPRQRRRGRPLGLVTDAVQVTIRAKRAFAGEEARGEPGATGTARCQTPPRRSPRGR